jgi:putative transposase
LLERCDPSSGAAAISRSKTWRCASSSQHSSTPNPGRDSPIPIGSFWILLSKIWRGWRSALHVVRPETVVRWHRQGFRYYWRWKSRGRGRATIDPEVIDLIRRMCRANPLWGAPRIHGELIKLGIEISETTVATYMIKRRDPPSQTWRTFLANHAKQTIALDFFGVPTATFRVLFVLILLSHDRRRLVHFNATEHPHGCLDRSGAGHRLDST